ncbi:hypothetical protein OBBRIDRAFT_420638 [Obba rivulosa]|uniref:Uncharacterized protein n=1 Tax=Obba rivulosa TaxID=1052685 RepID=A0A8E2DEV0_9APHY|nr:hypothetical protein OBBRIDRAFT_420638 [Obba rivulosa]
MGSDLYKISEILQQDRFAGLANLTIRFPSPYWVVDGISDQVRDLQTRIFAPFIERGILKPSIPVTQFTPRSLYFCSLESEILHEGDGPSCNRGYALVYHVHTALAKQ